MRARHPLLFVFLICLPVVCEANMGIPAGTYSFVWSVVLFVPIVLCEAWVLRHDLKLSYGRAVGTTFPSNILSTLAGLAVPVLTIPFTTTEGVFADAITLLLFIPLFYISRTIEVFYTRWSLSRVEKADIRHSVHRANMVSYAMLGIFVVTRFFKSWYVNGYIVP
jgi:hypothetical protein